MPELDNTDAHSMHTFDLIFFFVLWFQLNVIKCNEVWHDSIEIHAYLWHDSCIRIRTCDVTLSYVWHDYFICVTWLFHMCDMTISYVWHDSFIYSDPSVVSASKQMCDSAHSCTFTCAIRHMCDRTHSYSFIVVTWLIHMCDMTHSYVWHDALTYSDPSVVSVRYKMWHDLFIFIHMCDMTHSCAWHDSFLLETWLIRL